MTGFEFLILGVLIGVVIGLAHGLDLQRPDEAIDIGAEWQFSKLSNGVRRGPNRWRR